MAKTAAKYERISKMEAEVLKQQLNDFQHIETKFTNETIDKFELIVENCHQQGVLATERK